MGYRSDVVIGIKKEIWVQHLLSPCIPEALLDDNQVDRTIGENAVYFVISHWKWYESYPEIHAIEQWFDSMQVEDYGAMRIGENDDDLETWGDPYEFEIHLNRTIDYPYQG